MPADPMIALVDAGTGNLRSVEKALRHVLGSREALVTTSDPAEILRADRIVMPGQGAFGDCGRALAPSSPLGKAILDVIADGRPYLGICLGMQVLFESSEEAPECRGFGVLAGEVVSLKRSLPLPEANELPLKVPHMGWNDVVPSATPHPLLAATAELLGEPSSRALPFYFVHGYHALPRDPDVVAATAEYGPLRLVAAVARRNLFAVQFHPEKSQKAGLALLRAFIDWTPSL